MINSLTDKHLLASVTIESEPTKYSEAVTNPKWKKAMKQKITALENNGTWELTSLSIGKRALSSKWLYKVKHKANGLVEQYKARLVILGNTQKEGVDFTETFAPITKIVKVRTLLSASST